jgi:hypothetical protein
VILAFKCVVKQRFFDAEIPDKVANRGGISEKFNQSPLLGN